MTVSVNPTGLQGGTYSGIITIASSAATNSPQSVSVSLEVSLTDPGPTILVSQSSLSFAHQIGTELPAASNLQVSCLCFRGGQQIAVTATTAVTTPPGGNWLLVSPSAETFSTPATLTVSVDTTGLPEGTYSGTITIASSVATNSPQSVSVSFTVTQPPALIPQINPGGIVNGASFRPAPAPVSPGSIISIFGSNLADDLQLASDVPLPTTLGNTSVSFNGIVAPLFAISDGQINAQVPFDILPGDVSVQVMRGSETSVAQPITVADVSPGIFSLNQQGTGQGAVLISNTAIFAVPSGSIPGQEARPANRLEFISIFCSGLGDVTNRPPSGMPPSGNGLSVTLATPTVTVGGVIVSPSFSGLTNFVGLYQVDVQVPSDAPTGDAVEVVVTIGGVSSNTVTIAVQ
ncbi:MAG: hypothetical protein IH846_11655 [Acidobacteria bacterium]|nr:hypothetical protein [Acidobacteriota bacterium]